MTFFAARAKEFAPLRRTRAPIRAIARARRLLRHGYTVTSTPVFTRDLRFASAITRLAAALLLVSAAAGLALGARMLYASEPLRVALIAQDAVALVFGLPLLVISAWSARRGSIRGLLCWIGALFYLAYFWFFHVVGVQFGPLLPAHIVIVSIGMFGALYLFVGLNAEALKSCFSVRLQVRSIAVFLMGTAAAFAVAWLVLIVSRARSGEGLDSVTRLVVAVDGVVLLPLMFFGGLWLWRREPLGYVLAAMLLVKSVATFLTLAVTSLAAWTAGSELMILELAAYGAGLIVATLLLFNCLASLEDNT
jgi:hypothetical protein